jgi:hypothetical protein
MPQCLSEQQQQTVAHIRTVKLSRTFGVIRMALNADFDT